MLRFVPAAFAVLAAAGSAIAQNSTPIALDAPAPPSTEPIDFILRPTQGPDDDFWINQLANGLAGTVGPPLAGPAVARPDVARPDGSEPIGPPFFGPPLPPRLPTARLVRRSDADADPFAATGIRLGTLLVRPAIEVGVSVTDNVAGGRDKQSAVGLLLAPELYIRSEDDRHELEASFAAEAVLYGDEEFDDREAEARIRGRYDLTKRTVLTADAGYRRDQDSYTDPDTPDAAVERPGVHSLDASLGVTQRFGRIDVGLRGDVDRETHEDVALAGGGTAERDELDNTQYGLRLRTSHANGAALSPFVEVAAGRREYDVAVDSDGFERSSLWGELRGGLVLDLGSRLSGEAAIGYRREDLDDTDLEPINAFLVDASILWQPRPLTELRLILSTDVDSTGIPGASGSIDYEGGLVAAHRIGARWRAEAGIGLEYETYVGSSREDVTASVFTGLSYAFSRTASVRARYSYERTDSTDPDGDEDENVVSVRMRLQR